MNPGAGWLERKKAEGIAALEPLIKAHLAPQESLMTFGLGFVFPSWYLAVPGGQLLIHRRGRLIVLTNRRLLVTTRNGKSLKEGYDRSTLTVGDFQRAKGAASLSGYLIVTRQTGDKLLFRFGGAWNDEFARMASELATPSG